MITGLRRRRMLLNSMLPNHAYLRNYYVSADTRDEKANELIL